MSENNVASMTPRRFEQVQCADCIHVEVIGWSGHSEIGTGLCSSMDEQSRFSARAGTRTKLSAFDVEINILQRPERFGFWSLQRVLRTMRQSFAQHRVFGDVVSEGLRFGKAAHCNGAIMIRHGFCGAYCLARDSIGGASSHNFNHSTE